VKFRGSIVVSIPACHAGDPGSIPGLGAFLSTRQYRFMFPMLSCRIRGRAVKALRSGRSQLCWRGFESHRMQLFSFGFIELVIYMLALIAQLGER
jgi:hypothetical protein